MAADDTKMIRKKKGAKHWALFALRWGVAAVGVWLVVKNMSLHDKALVILDHTTNQPVSVTLSRMVSEDSQVFPVIDPANASRVIQVPREDVLNAPDEKKVNRVVPGAPAGTARSVTLLGVDLTGDLSKNPIPSRLLIRDNSTGVSQSVAQWIPAAEAPAYVVKVPTPREQVGLETLVKGARPSLLWAALLVFPITFLITSYRWHELLKPLDIHIGLGARLS